MTSTSFNIGLTTGEKNSSRVLRPPGGGHSDIFGIREHDNGIVTPSKKRNQPQSTIGSCFNMGEMKQNGTQPKNKEPINGEQFQNGSDENRAPSEPEEKLEETKEVQTPGPKRVRVPPGGFSSALW